MKYKSRIYLVIFVFAVIVLAMFFFVFGMFESRNRELSAEVSVQRQTLDQLQKEQKSYDQGKKDLATIQGEQVQPDDLFSNDTHVVKEIQTMEDLSKSYALDMNLQVSGTSKDAQKVPTSTQLLSVPYTLSVTGTFDKVLAFLDTTENLSFISPVQTISISAQKSNIVKTTVTAYFYIKKQ